jgi:hypothetical protein
MYYTILGVSTQYVIFCVGSFSPLTIVPTSDATYTAWLTAGNLPTPIQTLSQLQENYATMSAAQLVALYTAAVAVPYTVSDLQLILLFALNVFLNANGQLPVMIAAGSSTSLTGTQFGTFLATAANNYRTLRAAINAATTVTQLNAINVLAGWPSNP